MAIGRARSQVRALADGKTRSRAIVAGEWHGGKIGKGRLFAGWWEVRIAIEGEVEKEVACSVQLRCAAGMGWDGMGWE